MEEIVRIRDLSRPVQTKAARHALEHAERRPVTLTVDAVLNSAQDETGLRDFGAQDFRDRLRYQLEKTATQPTLSKLGCARIFQTLVRYAKNRLRLQDLLQRNPEIHDIQIRQPIIVVGLPRSGTTHLLNLLAADSRMRSLRMWECNEPIPAPGDSTTLEGHDLRIDRCAREWQETVELLPYFGAFHPLDPDHAEEEHYLQGPNFPNQMLELFVPGAMLPGVHGDENNEDDQRQHYAYMRTMLKALQWQRGPDRWVLKSPHHCMNLSPLLETFPDATFVMTHRDPIAVIQSLATFQAYMQRIYYHRIDTDLIGSHITDFIKIVLRKVARDRKNIPKRQIVDVFFHQFMMDEIKTAERVYSAAGLPLTEDQRARLAAFLRQNPRDKHGRVDYRFKVDFGIDPNELRGQFDGYYEDFPVRVERVD